MSTTKTIVIDEMAALDALRKTVEKYGSDQALLKDCTYTAPVDGWNHWEYDEPADLAIAPACILGCAFHDVLGIPLDALKLMDSNGGNYGPDGSEDITSFNTLLALSAYGITIDAVALDVFEVAQKVQDKGDNWGYALAKAEAYAEKLRNGEVNGTEGAGATA